MSGKLLSVGVLLVMLSSVSRADEPGILDESVVPAAGIRDRVAPFYCPPRLRSSPVYPDCPPLTPSTPGMPGAPTDPSIPPIAPPNLEGLTTPFATQTGGGGLQGRSFNESFDGDFGGMFYRRSVVVGSRVETVQVGTRRRTITEPPTGGSEFPTTRVIVEPVYGNIVVPTTREVLVPVGSRYNGISITDNDSPRPTDRLYFNYSYYDGIGGQMNPDFGNVTMNRPMVGFEKTILDGNASIGLRLPFIQLNGPPGTDVQGVGDLTVLTKFALINDLTTGNILSVGLVITTPTGVGEANFPDGTTLPHSTLFQPWVGFVRMFDRGYVQGISAVIVPTDRRDTTLLANSLGVGWWLYRAENDRFLRGITPVAEVHIRTPLNNRNNNSLVYLQDQVNVTGGMHFRFPRASIGGAVCVPTVAPRPWNVEAIGNFTLWF
jgi:hypothetical protein